MMTQFELTTMWNYRTNMMDPVLIQRSFIMGSAHITVLRRFTGEHALGQ